MTSPLSTWRGWIDAGLRSLAAETRVGAEVLGPRGWLRMPETGKRNLVDILNRVEKEGDVALASPSGAGASGAPA